MKQARRVRTFIVDGYHRFLESQQFRLSSNYHGLISVSILGFFCGVIAGGVIVLFRLFIELVAEAFHPGGNSEAFEQMQALHRLLLCVGGGLLIGIVLHFLKPKTRQAGVVHVMERLDYHQGKLPWKNAVLQFFAASVALLSGHSVGREGPSIHLGAASGSILGRVLQAPNNSVRILVASGVAAAIAAAFNTPLAGVVFAMEVVVMEYTVIGFTPVILAAVSATTIARLTLGANFAIDVPEFSALSVYELPFVALMGAFIGCVSAAFIQLTMIMNGVFSEQSIWLRTTLAGLITGVIALYLPQIMGTGYDTINELLVAQFGVLLVVLLIVAKLVASAAAIGLGVPAGLIGPTIFIGAAAGSLFGLIALTFSPEAAGAGYYAMLGMAAMMAATLQAPLAALIYLVELNGNQTVIFPGMMAVVIAALVSNVVFKKSSIYRHLMLARGLDYRNSPMSMALRRVGVASVMERNLLQLNASITATDARSALSGEPRWILVSDSPESEACVLPTADLARYLSERDVEGESAEKDSLNLLKIPAKHQDSGAIPIIATLQEAHEKMQSGGYEILHVTGAHGSAKKRIYGIITQDHIENSYRQ